MLDAATCALISMDSTMKSNVSVGPPIDVQFYKADSYDLSDRYRFDVDDPFLIDLRREWGNKLNQAFSEMPRMPKEHD
jgi:putative proteasome-type protease